MNEDGQKSGTELHDIRNFSTNSCYDTKWLALFSQSVRSTQFGLLRIAMLAAAGLKFPDKPLAVFPFSGQNFRATVERLHANVLKQNYARPQNYRNRRRHRRRRRNADKHAPRFRLAAFCSVTRRWELCNGCCWCAVLRFSANQTRITHRKDTSNGALYMGLVHCTHWTQFSSFVDAAIVLREQSEMWNLENASAVWRMFPVCEID